MTFEKIRKIIAEQLAKDEQDITMDTDIQAGLEADSLDLFQIISDIEEEFGIRIENAEGIKTVGDLVQHCESSEK